MCIAIVHRDERIRPSLERHAPSALRISAITLAELRFGVARSAQPRRAAANLNALLSKVGVVPFDEAATAHYGVLRALLERRGAPVGPHDMLVAAHAVSLRRALATRNVRAFRRVPGLAVDDWLT